MKSVPISPSFHALMHAINADKEGKPLSPLPPSSHLHPSSSSPHAGSASPTFSSFLSARSPLSSRTFRSPPSAAQPSQSSTLTGMSILKMPPSAASASPTRDADSPSPDGDASVQSSSSPGSPVSSLASLSHPSSSSPHSHRPGPTPPSPRLPPSPIPPSASPPTDPHTPLTSLLPPHSSTLQVRRNSTGGSGITRLLSSFKARTKPSLTSAAPLSAFKVKKPQSAEASDASGGSSCHQCKSRRGWGDLTYCTSSLNKKNKNAVCRKKYCTHCLQKFYRENPAPASSDVWKCPSCRKLCCCAACRRWEMRGSGGGGGVVGMGDGGVEDGSVTPPGGFLSPYVGHRQREQREDVHMSPQDSPPGSALRELMLSPHTAPALPPLPASALSSRERLLEEAHRDPSSSSPKSAVLTHRTLLSVGNSPALTALSAAASSLNGGSYGLKKEKSASLYGGLLDLSSSLGRAPVMGAGLAGLNGHSILNGHARIGERAAGHSRTSQGAEGMNGDDSDASHTSSASDNSDDDDAEDDDDDSGERPDTNDRTTTGGDAREHDHAPGVLTNGGSASAAAGTDTMGVLPNFALFYAVGQLPAVQEAVRGVMRRKEDSNADKLKDIEELFYTFAERVGMEEIALTL